MNNIAISPNIAMYALQIQNIKRDVAKKVDTTKKADTTKRVDTTTSIIIESDVGATEETVGESDDSTG